jgi:hypothetical protein
VSTNTKRRANESVGNSVMTYELKQALAAARERVSEAVSYYHRLESRRELTLAAQCCYELNPSGDEFVSYRELREAIHAVIDGPAADEIREAIQRGEIKKSSYGFELTQRAYRLLGH